MAWRGVGPFFVGGGQTVRVTFWWGRIGDDKGPQWSMAHPMEGQQPVRLVADNHSKSLNYEIGWVRSDGARGFDEDSRYYQYHVDVTNTGGEGVMFTLEGGGV